MNKCFRKRRNEGVKVSIIVDVKQINASQQCTIYKTERKKEKKELVHQSLSHDQPCVRASFSLD